MLIDFTVENFRSIRGPVTLSLVAQSRTQKASMGTVRRGVKADQEIAASIPISGRGIELLPAVGIFGANASGKSNMIRALATLLDIVGRGPSEIGYLPMMLPPFGLDNTSSSLPTRFEIRVAADGCLYTYGLEVDRTRILREKLELIPPPPKRRQNRLLFERTWLEDREHYRIKNGSDLGETYREIQEALQDHEPFMNLLSRKLNVVVVSGLSRWLELSSFSAGAMFDPARGDKLDRLITDALFAADPDQCKRAGRMIRAFDTGISSVEVRKSVDSGEVTVSVGHDVNGTKVRWGMDKESAGTQKLFGLLGKVLAGLDLGSLVLIDELGSSLHPNIARAVVRLFQSQQANPRHGQLIFTSHDNTLQRGNLLRRDQIWFTEKRDDASTSLYPLTDFRPRNDLALDKAYLDGRFGAIPTIPSDEDLIAALEKAD